MTEIADFEHNGITINTSEPMSPMGPPGPAVVCVVNRNPSRALSLGMGKRIVPVPGVELNQPVTNKGWT